MVTAQALLLALALSAPGEIVLLEFSAAWCEHCRGMEHTVSSLRAAGYPIERIDVDRRPEVASQFRVTGVPCFVLLDNGREIDRLVGAASSARLVEMFEQGGFLQGSDAPTVPVLTRIRGQSPESRLPLPAVPDPRQWFGSGPSAPQTTPPPPADQFRAHGSPNAASPDPRHPPSDPRYSPATHMGGSLEQPLATDPRHPPTTHSGHPPTVGFGGGFEPAVPASMPSRQPPAATAGPAVFEECLAASVRIRVADHGGHSYGSGTVIDTHGGEALVVTCGHIFRDSRGQGRIVVDLLHGSGHREVPGTLISYDLDRDIALVSMAPGVPLRGARVAPAGYRIEPGMEVFSIGCNQGAVPTIERSRVTAVDKYLGPPNVEVAGQPVDGRSGGGLFSADGQLIGICNAADPADNEGVFAGLPTVHWELDRIGQRRVYESQQMQLAAAASGPGPGEGPVRGTAAAPGTRELPRIADGRMHGEPAGDAEIICIVRSRSEPGAPGRLFIFDRPSRELLSRITQESAGTARAGLVPIAAETWNALSADSAEPLIRAQSTEP